jgi:hypothetical protein
MIFDFLKRLFSRKPPTPAISNELPDWTRELIEAIQKLGRSQIKATVRVETMESKLEGGFAELRSAIAAARPANMPAQDPTPLLDALDILDEARRSLLSAGLTQEELGLARVSERIESFLKKSGLARYAAATEPLDGRLFRIVGTVDRADLHDGAPVQVVRAAAIAGDRVIREGEIIINRRTTV